MRFTVEQAGPHWRGWEWLAVMCAAASVSRAEADAAWLIVSGCPMPLLGSALSRLLGTRVHAKQARYLAWEAGIRLRRHRRDLAAEHRREAMALLACVRNVRPAHPGLQVYAEKWGIIDREPVRFRSRLDGEHPDDLCRHPIRFLRDLGRLRAAKGASVGPGG